MDVQKQRKKNTEIMAENERKCEKMREKYRLSFNTLLTNAK